MIKSGKYGEIQAIELGSGILITKQETETEDGKTFIIKDVDCIDPLGDVIVYVDDSEYTGNKRIDFLTGKIEFPDEVIDEVTVTCEKLVSSVIGGFFSWELNVDIDNEDKTTFANNGFKSFIPILKGADISAGSYFDGDENSKIVIGEYYFVKLYADKIGGEHYRCFATVSEKGIGQVVDGIIESDISMVVDGNVIYVEDVVLSSDAFVTSETLTVDQLAGTINGVAETGEPVFIFKKYFTPAAGATFEIYESDGVTVVEQTVFPNDILTVTAEDGVTTKSYMLLLFYI